MIHRAKFSDIVTLKVLRASPFSNNSDGKIEKILNPKMKLNKTNTSFPVQVL